MLSSVAKRFASTLYFLLCALEGLGALIYIYYQPMTRAQPVLLGLGLGRLALPIALATLLFIVLAVREWRTKPAQAGPVEKLLAHRFTVCFAFLVFLLGLAGAYLAVYSPLHLGRLDKAIQGWAILPAWASLVGAQFFILALWLRGPGYWVTAWRDLRHDRRLDGLRRASRSPAAGLALLALSFLIGITKVYYGRFVDEADTITVGWLVSQGYTLYHSVFSHHFPLPYYWAALVVRLFGNSFAAIRISLLLLQLLLFAISMRLTRYDLAIGLTALAWNLINQFVRGQEALYATFEGLFMAAAAIVILAILVRRSKPGKATLIYIGLLLGAAVLSDPLMLYPAAVAWIALAASGLQRPTRQHSREVLRRFAWSGGALALVLGVFAVQLLASGTAGEFYRDAIWFNAEIYSKYVPASPLRGGVIAQYLVSGLDVFNPRWVAHTSPFLPLNTYRSVSLADENQYAAWVFSGLLFRLSILACVLGLLLRRRIAAGIFLYTFSAALVVRAADGMYAIGFTLVSLLAAFYLLVELRRPSVLRALAPEPIPIQKNLTRLAWTGVVVVIGGMQAWSAFRGGHFLLDNASVLRYDRHITQYNKFGRDIRALACDQPDLELAVFPVNPIVYFVTRIPPATKYTFMYPWVAEIGQQEVIDHLRSDPPVVVWINVDRGAGTTGGVSTYMADTIQYLNDNYILVDNGLWVSPELARRCGIRPGQSPFNLDEDTGQ
jgi:hypothetical protein